MPRTNYQSRGQDLFIPLYLKICPVCPPKTALGNSIFSWISGRLYERANKCRKCDYGLMTCQEMLRGSSISSSTRRVKVCLDCGPGGSGGRATLDLNWQGSVKRYETLHDCPRHHVHAVEFQEIEEEECIPAPERRSAQGSYVSPRKIESRFRPAYLPCFSPNRESHAHRPSKTDLERSVSPLTRLSPEQLSHEITIQGRTRVNSFTQPVQSPSDDTDGARTSVRSPSWNLTLATRPTHVRSPHKNPHYVQFLFDCLDDYSLRPDEDHKKHEYTQQRKRIKIEHDHDFDSVEPGIDERQRPQELVRPPDSPPPSYSPSPPPAKKAKRTMADFRLDVALGFAKMSALTNRTLPTTVTHNHDLQGTPLPKPRAAKRQMAVYQERNERRWQQTSAPKRVSWAE